MSIATASDAARLLAPLFARPRGEKLIVLHLDAGKHAIAIDDIALQHEPLRAIVRSALTHESAGLVIAHSHPSGDPSPSPEDIDATRHLAEIGARLGIRLHDHLIFAGRACRSFRQLGLL